MKTFKQYLQEGGNVKVGDISAHPIAVNAKNRGHVLSDVEGMLHHLHNSFHKTYGSHLFGENKKALHTGAAYSGSTKHLFDRNISDADFAKHKKSLGDIDVQVPAEHMAHLKDHLSVGKKFGKYTIAGVKHSGSEHHALMKHENGQVHQVDFEKTQYHKNEPEKYDQFSHSSDWQDSKSGIKGMHHKLLLNAVGGTKHKFSVTLGLGSREHEGEWEKDPKKITHKLFGQKAHPDTLNSFHNLAHGIKQHIPANRHQEIFDKFTSDLKKHKNIDHTAAVSHLASALNLKGSIHESVEVHHASVIPLTGFSPFSHMGHAKDLGATLAKMPGTKHVGISTKSEHFSDEERKNIIKKQWGQKDTHYHVIKGAGESIAKAHDLMPKTGKKVLHLLVGHDRKSFAEGLKKSLEAGKIKEMEGKHFDEVHLHYPADSDRSHGMSGTNMRKAAHEGNLAEFHRHIGASFSKNEASHLMKKTQDGINSGAIKLKR